KRCSTTSASILLTQRFSHRRIIMPELHGLHPSSAAIVASGARYCQRDLKLANTLDCFTA
ncbi:MAG TPA: hypothetical protein VNO24_24990, partial [Blastocatellia bacterium]|nr:hypothetical protein [Blastocatellia bacterium]